MRHYSFIPVILVLLVMTPVSAAEPTGYMLSTMDTLKTQKIEFNDVYNITYDASVNGNAIMLIHFKVPMDHQVDYVIYTWQEQLPGSASTYWNVSIIPPTSTTSSITFSGETKTYSYLDTNPEFDYFLSGYAKETTTNQSGIIIYNAGYGSFDNSLAIFHPVSSLSTNLIYRIDLSSDAPFDADITYAETSAVASSSSKDAIQIALEWVNFALSIVGTIKDVVWSLFTWIKFFLIDNGLMMVSLYITISMAYSACTAKNIFRFLGKFINDQIKLFHFLLGLWKILVDIIAGVRSWF
jgi:hypothetical protein